VLDVVLARSAEDGNAARRVDVEREQSLDGDALLSAILNAAAAPPDAEARKGRAKFMIALTTCLWCKRTVQHGGGKTVAVDAPVLERAQCDAQVIGRLDGDPEKATQAIPPRVRRLVMHRDGYRCRVPGCRSARFLEVHHIVHRADGGDHDPSGLVLLCDGHHKAHHEGFITIGGRAPDYLTFHHGSRSIGGHRAAMDDTDSIARPIVAREERSEAPHVGRDDIAVTHVGRDGIGIEATRALGRDGGRIVREDDDPVDQDATSCLRGS
jgi:hypothetical protein